jgi:hypothetical protein
LGELVERADQIIVKVIQSKTIMQHDDSNLKTNEEAIIPADIANLNTITATSPCSDMRKQTSSHWVD